MISLVSKGLAITAACVLSALLALTIYVSHFSATSSPLGQHCWNEVSSSQPFGIEKICMNGSVK